MISLTHLKLFLSAFVMSRNQKQNKPNPTFNFGASTYGESLIRAREYASTRFAPYDVRQAADQCFGIYQSGDHERFAREGCYRKVDDGYVRRW
jgi:hypothetical protein